MKRRNLVALLMAAACGAKSPAPTAPGTGTGPATAVLPDVPFDSLDHEQRIQFMKEKVVPTMEPIFKNHDAKDFAEFGCKTCHGEAVEKGVFDMPNAKLPVLDFSDMSKFKPEDLKWMKTEVLPTMAKLVKQPEYSQENPKGFGCLECHTAKQ